MGQWLHVQMHFTLTMRVGTCMSSITMEMVTDIKYNCDKNKIKQ